MKRVVFSDFDGTISSKDVGYNMFRHFSGGKSLELIPKWKKREISSRQCLTMEAEMSPLTEAELYDFLDTIEISSGFVSFVGACRENEIELMILSDGLDLYIDYLFKKHGISDLRVMSNSGTIQDGHIEITFPYDNTHCDYCGNCKGERIAEYRAQQKAPVEVLFVGDGYSDACAVTESDIVMAKKDLEEHCQKNNISYYTYTDFHDVTNRMTALNWFKS